MTDLTTQPPMLSVAYSAHAETMIELAKMLALIAPTSMTTEQQELWLRAAADALEDIRPKEVQEISAELRRSVTRPNQVVPEIARLVAEKRARASRPPVTEGKSLYDIDKEAQHRMSAAHTQAEVEEARAWERHARIESGFAVPPIAPPLTASELRKMPRHIRELGLTRGLLEYRDGQLAEVRL